MDIMFRARRVGLFCLGLLALWGANSAPGQVQVLIRHDGRESEVVSMDGRHVVIEENGRRERVEDGQVFLREAGGYTDGAVRVIKSDAMMGRDYAAGVQFFFRFEAVVEAERDFEDCFVLFGITPEVGDPTYVLREIQDIDQGGRERVVVAIPVNPGFGGGSFGYKFFSRGEEIEVIDMNRLTAIRDTSAEQPEAAAVAESQQSAPARRVDAGDRITPTSARKARLLEFPPSLVGVLQGGYAEATYTVGEDGRALEILELRADHPDLIPEAWKTITETIYNPGTLDGQPLVTTVQQRFFFNEFASFAEEIVSVPYPSINDREPQVVYSPLAKTAEGRKGKATIELEVDLLGRPVDPVVFSASNDAAGEEALTSVEDWIFLPGIVEGYPQRQRVRLPFSFAP